MMNRMLTHEWPAVVMIKGIPDHPEGAIRYPRPELRERWEKLGLCKPYKKRGRPKK